MRSADSSLCRSLAAALEVAASVGGAAVGSAGCGAAVAGGDGLFGAQRVSELTPPRPSRTGQGGGGKHAAAPNS